MTDRDTSHRRRQPHCDDPDLIAQLAALRDGYGDVHPDDAYDATDPHG